MLQRKLVRDKIGERDNESITVLPKWAGTWALTEKLWEETGELVHSGWRDPAEYADVIEVLKEIARRHGVDWDDVEAERQRKHEEFGGFTMNRMLIMAREDR